MMANSSVDVLDVAQRIKLVTFSTGKPGFARQNKSESDEIKKRNSLTTAEADAKAIVSQCENPNLEAYAKVAAAARVYHRAVTQPSITDGMRLVPVGVEMDHIQKMAEFKRECDGHKGVFMDDYPRLRLQAPVVLNGLYDPRPWKTPEEIERKFRFDLEYLPCPTHGRWANWLQASIMAADEELTERLEKAINKVAERCAAEGPLYDTVFSNLREILDLVPHLNLASNPNIARIAKEAQRLADKNRDRLADKRFRGERLQTAVDAERIASMFQFVSQAG